MIHRKSLANKLWFFHLVNVGALFVFVWFGIYFSPESSNLNPWKEYGWFRLFIYLSCYVSLLGLPQSLFNFLGLTLFQSFPEPPKLKNLAVRTSKICFRVVTRGDYPEMVRNNVFRNIGICKEAGLTDYLIEVVTDKTISIGENELIREVVVPPGFQTRSGAMFKARALQYALEDEVNILKDSDWIVHLDEETILTEGSVNGIVNFICEGTHQFGQGVITYVNDGIVNLMLTLCDTQRVGEDMGKIQFQLKVLHMPIIGWKGSYVVSLVEAERKVSFDNGPDSSVAEDTYFGLFAASLGYSFSFIGGDMWEKSPFNVIDFLQQRKRWLQGILLVAHSSRIPWRYRILISMSIYSWLTAPLLIFSLAMQSFFPVDLPQAVNYCLAFNGSIWMYLYVYGTFRSFNSRKVGVLRMLLYVLAGKILIPVKVFMELTAVVWGIAGPKHKFFIVKKDRTQSV